MPNPGFAISTFLSTEGEVERGEKETFEDFFFNLRVSVFLYSCTGVNERERDLKWDFFW